MEIKLDQQHKQELEAQHKSERDVRIRDRIKAVLLNSEGWSNQRIAQALRIHEIKVATHLSDFVNLEKLKPENGGSESKLNEVQTDELLNFLTENTFTSTFLVQQHIPIQIQLALNLKARSSRFA